MTARPRTSRWWLALAYALAVVVTQSAHDHDRGADDAALGAAACCSCPLPHLSSHALADAGHGRDHCPACQFRAHPHALQLQAAPLGAVSVAELPVLPAPATRRGSILRPSCRAPPRV